jgi:uncharacterized FlgJ-related protein
MKFDQDIPFEFLPEEDKKFFQVWDSVTRSKNYSSIPESVESIVATIERHFKKE